MYGIFRYDNSTPRVGWKHGAYILDLELVSLLGYFDGLSVDTTVFVQSTLNAFIRQGKVVHEAVRQRINELRANDASALTDVRAQVLVHESRAVLQLPIQIGDYTDFYAGIHHAENVGRMFRPQAEPLLPNYRHLPVGYHGRASSIVVSGTPIRRPSGQFLEQDKPVFGPSRAMDFELELGLIIGKENPLGKPVPVAEAEEYIFGVVLFNDWSARDLQRWEYQPLGPFLGKSFASSLSAWVLPFAEMGPFRVPGMLQVPTPLPYLQSARSAHFDLNLDVWLQPENGEAECISRSNAQFLYWNFAQLIAHHTVNGCNLRVGDVLATGTISGPTPGSNGSLLELGWNGQQPITLSSGITRTFLNDGDTVTLRASAERDGHRLTLGEVSGQLLSALPA